MFASPGSWHRTLFGKLRHRNVKEILWVQGHQQSHETTLDLSNVILDICSDSHCIVFDVLIKRLMSVLFSSINLYAFIQYLGGTMLIKVCWISVQYYGLLLGLTLSLSLPGKRTQGSYEKTEEIHLSRLPSFTLSSHPPSYSPRPSLHTKADSHHYSRKKEVYVWQRCLQMNIGVCVCVHKVHAVWMRTCYGLCVCMQCLCVRCVYVCVFWSVCMHSFRCVSVHLYVCVCLCVGLRAGFRLALCR